jgi:hypothetical protein
MVKKTWIDKQEIAPAGIENKPVDQSAEMPSEIPVTEKQTDLVAKKVKKISQKNGSELTPMGRELQENEIQKTKTVRQPRVKKVKKRDEQGNLLKKDGTIDKRVEAIKKVQQKSKVYQQIIANKKLKEEMGGKVAVLTPLIESDSDDDLEFEIVDDTKPLKPAPLPKPESPPHVEIKRKPTHTEIYLKQQEEKRERELAEQMSRLKEMEDENKNLKNKFTFNDHLNRLTHLATNVKIRY